jgi:hypothetical protein
MAETLGALIDKLSIVDLKLWHCQEILFAKENQLSSDLEQLRNKNESLLSQRKRLIDEIDQWISNAIEDPAGMVLVSPQNKMYGRFRKD